MRNTTPADASSLGATDLALGIGVMAPMLFAFNLPPSPTLLNQALAHGLWGVSIALLALAGNFERWRKAIDDVRVLIAAIASVALCVAIPVVRSHLPVSIALSVLATLASTMLVVYCGAGTGLQRRSTSVYTAFLWGVLGAGVLSTAISLIQVFAPDWSGNDLIARSGLPGRAVGNLRQPNHLASLLLWSAIATLGLLELRRLTRAVGVMISAFLIFGVVLSGSRTGVLGALAMGIWGLFDRRLSAASRMILMATPLVYTLAWAGMWAWAQGGDHVFGAERSLGLSGSDISSSRFAIWSNAWDLTAHEPLLGTGFGEFNVAWTLSRLPDRPVAFFDHTHNLPLQLLVELGVPLGSLVFGLLMLALYQAGRRAWASDGELGSAKRCAFMLVLMIGLHSLLEYPLWYAYFLLPTAFAWGFALSRQMPEPQRLSDPLGLAAQRRAKPMWLVVGSAMALGALTAVLDYRSVVVIYEPPAHAEALEERVVRGQRSPLFGHHADYAAATAFEVPRAAPLAAAQQLAFRRAPHQLLDVRLMIAWAQALAAQGELDKARWLAARILEFRNPSSDEFFAPCGQQPAPDAFQCQPPAREVDWREFTR